MSQRALYNIIVIEYTSVFTVNDSDGNSSVDQSNLSRRFNARGADQSNEDKYLPEQIQGGGFLNPSGIERVQRKCTGKSIVETVDVDQTGYNMDSVDLYEMRLESQYPRYWYARHKKDSGQLVSARRAFAPQGR